MKRGAGSAPVLPRSVALLCGTGLGSVLFGNLMVPSYGAGDLAAHGTPASHVVALATVGNVAVAVAGLVLAMTGWQPRWPWVSGAMALAAAGLLVPLFLPIASGSFVLFAGMALAVYGFGAGFGQLAEQTTAVASVGDEQRRSEAIGGIYRWHLVAGGILGGIPFFFSWKAGELGLVIAFGSLAVAVAMRRRVPDTGVRERMGLRHLYRVTGPAIAVVAIGQAAWTVMWLLPGILAMPAAVIALYAVAAQVAAWVALKVLHDVADQNRAVVAALSGGALLLAILGVAIFPAVITGAGVWLGLACFATGEVSANIFISAIEGHLSVEIGGQRSQLMGHASKFAAVGILGGLAALLARILAAHLTPAASAIWLGASIVVTIAIVFSASMHAVRRRQIRLAE